MMTLELITFPGPGVLPIWIAGDKGFFRDPEIAVNITPTPGSAYQIQHTVAGEFQIASTAIDNVVAYQEGQGVAELDRDPDLFVFMGNRNLEARTMLTREQVIEIVGEIEDWKIIQIVSTDANAEELLEAHTGIIEQGDLEAETERRMSGTVARLYEFLIAGEPRWPEGDEKP